MHGSHGTAGNIMGEPEGDLESPAADIQRRIRDVPLAAAPVSHGRLFATGIVIARVHAGNGKASNARWVRRRGWARCWRDSGTVARRRRRPSRLHNQELVILRDKPGLVEREGSPQPREIAQVVGTAVTRSDSGEVNTRVCCDRIAGHLVLRCNEARVVQYSALVLPQSLSVLESIVAWPALAHSDIKESRPARMGARPSHPLWSP